MSPLVPCDPRSMIHDPRVLIVRTDRIGDVVLSTPAIRAVRAAYPKGYVALMVQPATRPLVEGHPMLDEVITFDKEGIHRTWVGMWRLAQQLRARRFDLALILHTTNRVLLLTWLAGIRHRVGYARRLGALLTRSLPYVKRLGERHELDYTLDLVRFAEMTHSPDGCPDPPEGYPAQDRTLEIASQPEGQAPVEAWLREVGVRPEDRLLLLHPGASCPSKRWSPERFAAVADCLAETRATRIAVIAGPGEEGVADAVRRGAKAPVLAPPKPFTLAELPWLLKRAQCLVSNDSGPVHLACAVGTPVVAIFGRWGGGLSPTRWGPTGQRSVVLHHDVGCRPCLAHRCQIGFVCLQAVTVDEVVAAVKQATGDR